MAYIADFEIGVGEVAGQKRCKKMVPGEHIEHDGDAQEIPAKSLDGAFGKAVPLLQLTVVFLSVFPEEIGPEKEEGIRFFLISAKNKIVQAELVPIVNDTLFRHQIHDAGGKGGIIEAFIELTAETIIQRRGLGRAAALSELQKLHPQGPEDIAQHIPHIQNNHKAPASCKESNANRQELYFVRMLTRKSTKINII